jgi:type II secretory pathway pseudopilin PulG
MGFEYAAGRFPISGPVVSMTRRQRRRAAYTLIEVLIGVSIVVALAAVVVPTVVGRLKDGVVRREAADLSSLADAITTYHDNVGMWPSALGQLVVTPAAGDLNICGSAMASKDVKRWVGPYLATTIPSNGIIIQDDTIQPALTRSTAVAPTVLRITLKIRLAARAALQSIFEGDGDSTKGTIRWNVDTLWYNIPIAGC